MTTAKKVAPRVSPVKGEPQPARIDLRAPVQITMSWGKLITLILAAAGLYTGLYYLLDDRIDEIALRLANLEGVLSTLLEFLTNADSDGLAD